jgi:hypothetical protein
MKKYETEQAELMTAIPALKDKILSGRQRFDDTAKWVKHIRKYASLETVDEAILIELVERVEVGKPTSVDGETFCDIKIVYRYVGCVDEAVEEVQYDKAV